MTSLLDVAIERSVLSLQTLDQRLASMGDRERRAHQLERFQLEDRAIHLIATQQPIAGDLRFIVAVVMVVSEIERMGDYAAGIAKVTQLHESRQLLKPLVDIPEMTRLVREMLREAIDAFLQRNEHTAERVAFQDDESIGCTHLYGSAPVHANDPTRSPRDWLLWVAHNLGGMGDRIQNICERTVTKSPACARVPSPAAPRGMTTKRVLFSARTTPRARDAEATCASCAAAVDAVSAWHGSRPEPSCGQAMPSTASTSRTRVEDADDFIAQRSTSSSPSAMRQRDVSVLRDAKERKHGRSRPPPSAGTIHRFARSASCATRSARIERELL